MLPHPVGPSSYDTITPARPSHFGTPHASDMPRKIQKLIDQKHKITNAIPESLPAARAFGLEAIVMATYHERLGLHISGHHISLHVLHHNTQSSLTTLVLCNCLFLSFVPVGIHECVPSQT